MAQQIIGIGQAPNDGTGDPLRTLSIKANANFFELYQSLAFNAAGLATLTAWATATLYQPGQLVTYSFNLYRCLAQHASSVFLTDLTAGNWALVSALPPGPTGAAGGVGPAGATGGAGPTGAAGPAAWTPPAAWVTATAYVSGPPASTVIQGGETYVCLVSHTSGTFAADLGAGKWVKVAAKGADGAGAGDFVGPASSVAGRLVSFASNTGKAGADSGVSVSTDGTLAGNSDALVPTQKAVKIYADALIGAQDAMVFKGVIDCSSNPNYPAADRGWTYRASVAGKIGGASGVVVEVGDIIMCLTDGTASGNQATVGSNWTVIQTNIDGALTTAAIGVSVQAFDAQLFSNIPQNSQSAAYTCVGADAQKHILHPAADTTSRTFTIPANSSVAYPIGTAITFVNQNGAGAITIAITTDTMRLAGAGTTGSRTLAANGIATALKIVSTEWIISGSGLT